MEFFRRAQGHPLRLGILPGAFNPPTIAHLSLASAGLEYVEEVVFVLPRVFPHKHYSGATLDQRLDLLIAATAGYPQFSVAVTEGGLFAEIARECRTAYGRDVRPSFLCGRDAAERIAGWDYGSPGAFDEMLRDFDLLVAPRDGEYQAASGRSHCIKPLAVSEEIAAISSTEVRARISRGEAWEDLVPPAIRNRVRSLYNGATAASLDSPPGM